MATPAAASVQRRPPMWLSAIIVAVAMLAGGFASASTFREAYELQDDVLRQVGAMFDPGHLPTPGNPTDAPKVSDTEACVTVQVLPPAGAVPATNLPVLVDGMQTACLGKRGYRMWARTLANGQRIAVVQETVVRDEIARDSVLCTLMPFLMLVPILLLAVAHVLREIFALTKRLAYKVDQRDECQLYAIASETVPDEVRPFAMAINRLLVRVQQPMDVQHRLIADAAYEPRTSLSAPSLQAERLGWAAMPTGAQVRLGTLCQGIERSRGLLEQLLILTCTQEATGVPTGTVSVQSVFRSVLEDFMPFVDTKQFDMGIITEADARVHASELDLFVVVRNLVDNMIRYTPEGGCTDLSVANDAHVVPIAVQDTGPGVPVKERARVSNPFCRVSGSEATGLGFGLPIVSIVVRRLGGEVELGEADDRAGGLRVAVRLPAA